MKKNLLKICITFLFFMLVFAFFSCSSKKQGSLGKYETEIKKVFIMYLAREYSDVYNRLDPIIQSGDLENGDLFYMYAYCHFNRTNWNLAQKYFKKASLWYQNYDSEFKEDNKADFANKAIYNLGITYFTKASPYYSLQKTQEIWDYGLKKNPKNPYIQHHYPALEYELYKEELQIISSLLLNITDNITTKNEFYSFPDSGLLHRTNLERIKNYSFLSRSDKKEIDSVITEIEKEINKLK